VLTCRGAVRVAGGAGGALPAAREKIGGMSSGTGPLTGPGPVSGTGPLPGAGPVSDTGPLSGTGQPAGSLLDLPLGEFLDLVAARVPAPGGGGAAAITGALAAGLAAMAARFSAGQVADAPRTAQQADRLRDRLAVLADSDGAAYRGVLDAYALPREGDPGERRKQIQSALHGAAVVPLEIAELAAQVAGLAARLARDGNPRLRGDAVTAAHLAQAAACSAAALVGINVSAGGLGGHLSRRAATAVAAASDAVAGLGAA
jgi:methenyltetrahydrofolate cyclohydrolase